MLTTRTQHTDYTKPAHSVRKTKTTGSLIGKERCSLLIISPCLFAILKLREYLFRSTHIWLSDAAYLGVSRSTLSKLTSIQAMAIVKLSIRKNMMM